MQARAKIVSRTMPASKAGTLATMLRGSAKAKELQRKDTERWLRENLRSL